MGGRGYGVNDAGRRGEVMRRIGRNYFAGAVLSISLGRVIVFAGPAAALLLVDLVRLARLVTRPARPLLRVASGLAVVGLAGWVLSFPSPAGRVVLEWASVLGPVVYAAALRAMVGTAVPNARRWLRTSILASAVGIGLLGVAVALHRPSDDGDIAIVPAIGGGIALLVGLIYLSMAHREIRDAYDTAGFAPEPRVPV